MSTELKVNPETILAESLKNAKELYPQMVESSTKAKIALTKVQAITNDAEDEYAAKLLGVVKTTYDKVKGWRETVTKKLDGLKDEFMLPEKAISLEKAHKDSEAMRVKNLRDAYATKKVEEQQAQLRANQALLNAKEEIARLKAHFENSFFNATVNALATLEGNIEAHFNSITLENFEEKSKKFSFKPKLSADFYEALFIVDYDKNKLPISKFNEFLTQVKEQMPYTKIDDIYSEQATPLVTKWRDKLPARKTELEQIEDLRKTNANAAKVQEAEITRKANAEKDERERVQKEQIAANEQKVEQAANVEKQDAQFEAQVAQQTMSKTSGIKQSKQAIIKTEEVNVVKVLSQVMFACFTNPNFKGYVKRSPNGQPMLDDKGDPIYHEWVETLLDFYANNCDIAIDGIELKNIVKTITKRK